MQRGAQQPGSLVMIHDVITSHLEMALQHSRDTVQEEKGSAHYVGLLTGNIGFFCIFFFNYELFEVMEPPPDLFCHINYFVDYFLLKSRISIFLMMMLLLASFPDIT